MLELKGISKEAFSKLLDYIYSDSSQGLENHAMELMEAACLYEIPGLKSFCENLLIADLKEANAKEIFKLAHRLNLELLKTESFKVIQR